MRRVLLIADAYPPYPSIGSIRPGGLAKYLPLFGWMPIVVTRRLPEGPRFRPKVIETQYVSFAEAWKARLGLDSTLGLSHQLAKLPLPLASVRFLTPLYTRLVTRGSSVMNYPDSVRGWVPSALKTITEVGRTERVDAILSTAPPASCHLIARRAKDILKCPWIADFRDLWTQYHDYPHGEVRRFLEKRLERKTLQAADALVTVSVPLAGLLKERYPSQKVHCIPNGFDPEEFTQRLSGPLKSFSITYTGSLNYAKRGPQLLFIVMADLLREGILDSNEVQVHFYGPNAAWLSGLIEQYGLNGVVTCHGQVSRSLSLEAQRTSQLLLLTRWNDPKEAGVYTGKVFEYLGARRPIIALGGPPGVVPDLLNETNAGVHVTSQAQLRAFLIEAYAEFQRSGYVNYAGDEIAINRYTHQEMARKFALVLDTLTNNNRG
jgi:glycosyltransferase involved in cell wall biosynthesis